MHPNYENDTWINSYKYEVFCGCIREGIGNDSLRIILAKKDLFRPNMNMDFGTIEDARSLGKQLVQKLPTPFIKVDLGEESLRNKNFISYSCLTYYASRELDSIAREAYKVYAKSIKTNK